MGSQFHRRFDWTTTVLQRVPSDGCHVGVLTERKENTYTFNGRQLILERLGNAQKDRGSLATKNRRINLEW